MLNDYFLQRLRANASEIYFCGGVKWFGGLNRFKPNRPVEPEIDGCLVKSKKVIGPEV